MDWPGLTHPCCPAADHTAAAASLLSVATLELARNGTRINFMKTRALMGFMRARVPEARWFVNVDTDAVLNLLRLRAVLAQALAASTGGTVDYVGKALHVFAYRRRQSYFDGSSPFTYMQGGGYVLSPRAAASMSRCPRGNWSSCPNRFFKVQGTQLTHTVHYSSHRYRHVATLLI